MSKCLFGILCRRIEEVFGADKFMSEDHANALLSSQHADQSRNIYFAHAKSTGGVIYSRKGFFALNVQAIVDKKKRVLFRSIISRGAEHDSTAFKNSGLYQWLMHNWKSLMDKGYYFIGDSAYALKSFLLTPYDNAMHGTTEDNYNFFHSSSRISVECAFGEIDLRWGILWKELEYSLELNCTVIDVCMRAVLWQRILLVR